MTRPWEPIVFPGHALLIVEERLREQQAEGVRMPIGMPLDELALRVLMAATALSKSHRASACNLVTPWRP